MKISVKTVSCLLVPLFYITLHACVPADQPNEVKFKSTVELNVGEATVIHGARGKCGQLPSQADLEKSKSNLDAALTTGRITFGKPGVRESRYCGGWTPVYETIFVAEKPGQEQVEIYGNNIKFIVK